MTFRTKVKFSALTVFVAAVFAAGCGSDSPLAPSGLDLTGPWTGSFGSASAGSGDRAPATWAATQSGTSSTGAFVLTFIEDDGSSTKITGTLAGAVSGTQVAWTLSFPNGTFPPAPTCAVTGTGTSTATTTSSILVDLTVTFTPACEGVVSEAGQTSEINHLILNK
jgi:hypothetical protein